jgi:hypothetical protein
MGISWKAMLFVFCFLFFDFCFCCSGSGRAFTRVSGSPVHRYDAMRRSGLDWTGLD